MDISSKPKLENEERVAEEYLSSLADLTCNSKPLINMLTMLAEENIEFASVIVKVVEDHIAKVAAEIKLPILYLIDSIVKNVKSSYVQLFSQCIVNIFCGVFETVNEKIRERMYSLRQTWNEVFSTQKLYALDVKVKRMDSNWPITAQPTQPTSIHVNPNFLKTPQSLPVDMEEILQAKTRELLELKKRKLELELAATKKHIEEQQKHLTKATDSVTPAVEPYAGPAAAQVAAPIHAQLMVSEVANPGLISNQHSSLIPPNGVAPAPMVPSIYVNSNFRNPRPVQMPAQLPGVMALQGYGGNSNNLNKPKVHPVNPALLNTVRQRDPRLLRQQQHQQQQQQQQHQQQMQKPQTAFVNRNTSNSSDDKKKSDDKSSSYRKFGSRSSGPRSDRKSPSRNYTSSSSRSSSRLGKSKSVSSSSRNDRNKSDHKRSESKNSSSSSSSISLERRKSPPIREKKTKNDTKCDKDAFEIAPLSSYKRKSSSPMRSSSPESRRMQSKLRKTHSRSRSPIIEQQQSRSNAVKNVEERNEERQSKKKINENERIEETKTKSAEMIQIKESDTSITSPVNDESGKTKSLIMKDAMAKSQFLSRTKLRSKDNEDSAKDSKEKLASNIEQTDLKSVDVSDDKKRSMTVIASEDGPTVAKKIKPAAKLDSLFGTEDVDLRTLPVQLLKTIPKQTAVNEPSTPPPPSISEDEETASSKHNAENWDNLKARKSPTQSTTKVSSPKKGSRLDDVRAKLAKAAKYNSKTDKSNKDFSQRFKLAELNMNDDTQEANDEKIRIILTQAQEMMDANSMSQDQYKSLMQTVMTINETNKLKQAKRREAMSTKSSQIPKDDVSSSKSERISAREAILKKRIPKLPRSTAQGNSESTTSDIVENEKPSSPARDTKGTENVSKTKSSKEKRQKVSKWNDRNETTNPIVGNNAAMGLLPNRPWLAGSANSKRGFRSSVPHPPLPPSIRPPWHMNSNLPPPLYVGNNSSMPIMHGHVPPPPQPPMNIPVIPIAPNIPKPCNSIDNPQADMVRTITIDGFSKEIRIYDQTAIIFMDYDEPREIGFQDGRRSIIIDNFDPICLEFNADYKPFNIGNETHRMRFGLPSRELYIDDNWYEIYFGGPPVNIPVNNRMHMLKAEGPPPQVNIGAARRDLVLGRVNMIIDATFTFPVFLDAKVQRFQLNDQEHTLQFADSLQTVLIDGEPFAFEFGVLPKPMLIEGQTKRFVRFTALPENIVPGKVDIKNMIQVRFEAKAEIKPLVSDETNMKVKPELLPAFTELTSTVKPEDVKADESNTTNNISVESSAAPAATLPLPSLDNFNIDEILQKLISTGIINKPLPAATGSVVTTSGTLEKPATFVPEVLPSSTEEIIPIDLSRPDSIKVRQDAIIATLYTGMQCSSCGVRFPPEQTIKYSQHLDWHFRQNRRDRDSMRKAHSRKWYYEISDWIQYEEIEDLDDREKNFFETQQTQDSLDLNEDTSNQRSTNSPIPSCPAGPDDVDRTCDMCHERFDHFYNEELEEWHLHAAIRVEDSIYHPICYEDYKASLNPPEQVNKENPEEIIRPEDENAQDVIIKVELNAEDCEDNPKSAETIIDDDDDDDVIVLPSEEPSITEIVDDDDDEYVPMNVSKEEMSSADNKLEEKLNQNETLESDVEIQEPNIPFTDLDTYEEKELPPASVETADENSQMSIMNIKIKEEPKDGDEEDEDDAFEDVGTVLIDPDEEFTVQSEDTQSHTIISSSTTSPITTTEEGVTAATTSETQSAELEVEPVSTDLNLSIDGNQEPDDEHNLSSAAPTPTIPLASLVNRIKINITKTNVSTSSCNPLPNTTTTTNLSSTISKSSSDTTNSNNTTTVFSTIPVLCGGGVSSSSVLESSNGKNGIYSSGNSSSMSAPIAVLGAATNVSSISVIGSTYGSSSGNASSNSQYFNKITPPAPTPQRAATPPLEDTITYEMKPALKAAALKKRQKIECGLETSGLCSIM